MASAIVLPPTRVPTSCHKVNVFLAGSIEMGAAEDWQTGLAERLLGMQEIGHVFNPRRKDWDSSWKQSADHPMFNEQVNWELDHIELSDFIFFNFVPGTISPVTLAEFGFAMGSLFQIVVCCPDGYWRQGNVDIMCQRYGVKMHRNYEEACQQLFERVTKRYEHIKQFYHK